MEDSIEDSRLLDLQDLEDQKTRRLADLQESNSDSEGRF